MRSLYHEYTSSIGGKIFSVPSLSFLRKRFRLRKLSLVTSSLRAPSQLSCSVSISSLSSSLCSSESFATQASLSNLIGSVAGAVRSDAGFEALGLGFGAPKKDVMEAFCLGFLTASAAMSPALRLRDILVLEIREDVILVERFIVCTRKAKCMSRLW